MEVYRADLVNTDELMVNDVFAIELSDGEQCEVIVIGIENGNAVCTLIDALKDPHRMNRTHTTEGGYLESEMRKYLNSELLEKLPGELRERLVPDENGDYLRLFTEKEVFGTNGWAEKSEPKDTEQYEFFKNRRNRIALNGHNSDYPDWWWLQNPASASYFCRCDGDGTSSYDGAGSANSYVRPRFVIKM